MKKILVPQVLIQALSLSQYLHLYLLSSALLLLQSPLMKRQNKLTSHHQQPVTKTYQVMHLEQLKALLQL